MLHTFEDWFCSAKLLDFPFFCYCTFLYRLISVVSYFYLYFSYLRKRKTLPHEFFTNMPAHVAVAIKKRLIARNCRATYYQYHNGRRPITPDYLAFIEQVCREEGWTGPLTFDGETEDYVW